MLLAFLIYLIQFLSSLKVMTTLLALLSVVCAVVSSIIMNSQDIDGNYGSSTKNGVVKPSIIATHKFARLWVKRGLISALSLSFIAIAIPSQTTSYTMAAGYVTQTIAESPESKIIGEKVLKLINIKLDELIDSELNKVIDKNIKTDK